jgi:hypothetical protein
MKTSPCIRLPKGGDPELNAKHYEKCALFAMEEDDWDKADVYLEWARIELVSLQKPTFCPDCGEIHIPIYHPQEPCNKCVDKMINDPLN